MVCYLNQCLISCKEKGADKYFVHLVCVVLKNLTSKSRCFGDHLCTLHSFPYVVVFTFLQFYFFNFQAPEPTDPSNTANWNKATPVSLKWRMRELQRQISSSKEEELACRVKLSGLFTIVEDWQTVRKRLLELPLCRYFGESDLNIFLILKKVIFQETRGVFVCLYIKT